MSLSDILGDLLTRIRNSQNARFISLPYRASKLCLNVLDVLKKEGYIRGYEYVNSKSTYIKVDKCLLIDVFGSSHPIPSLRLEKTDKEIKIFLKYFEGKPVIRKIKRISKPGRRVYKSIKKLPKAYNGLGIYILSTPQGVISDREARIQNIGGEVLCKIL